MLGNMKRKNYIFLIIGFAAALLLAVLLAGCGGDSTTTAAATAPQCKADAPSIIPPPSGKPQHVYFFRDT